MLPTHKNTASQEKLLFSGAVFFGFSFSPSKILASPKLSELLPRRHGEYWQCLLFLKEEEVTQTFPASAVFLIYIWEYSNRNAMKFYMK